MLGKVEHNGLFHLTPAGHLRILRLVAPAFTPRTVDGLQPRIDERSRRYLADLVDAGGGDFAAQVAKYLPVEVIGDYLGFDEASTRWLRDHVEDIFALSNPFLDEPGRAHVEQGLVTLHEVLTDAFDDRRRTPRDDLLTRLVQAEEEGDRLNADELFVLVVAPQASSTGSTPAETPWQVRSRRPSSHTLSARSSSRSRGSGRGPERGSSRRSVTAPGSPTAPSSPATPDWRQ